MSKAQQELARNPRSELAILSLFGLEAMSARANALRDWHRSIVCSVVCSVPEFIAGTRGSTPPPGG
jgi:hypothetical protein